MLTVHAVPLSRTQVDTICVGGFHPLSIWSARRGCPTAAVSVMIPRQVSNYELVRELKLRPPLTIIRASHFRRTLLPLRTLTTHKPALAELFNQRETLGSERNGCSHA